LAVDRLGNPWIVNDAQEIFRWVTNKWTRMPGIATDIAAGPDGTVVIITPDGAVKKWEGEYGRWIKIYDDQVVTSLAVGKGGKLYVIMNERIYVSTETCPSGELSSESE
jgi:hypothetical protein